MDNSKWDDRPNGPPTDRLESLFLQEELFTMESPREWESRVARLEAENPFLQAFAYSPGQVFRSDMELLEKETGPAQNNGISSVAVSSIKEWSSSGKRPARWQGKIYGLVVHTSGSGIPK